MPRGNKNNLKVPTSEEARENGRKGGLASAKARRKKKAIKELAQAMLYSNASGAAKKLAAQFGGDLDENDMTNAAAIIAGQMYAAMKGNTNAARLIMEMIDLNPSESYEDDELTKSLEEFAKKL